MAKQKEAAARSAERNQPGNTFARGISTKHHLIHSQTFSYLKSYNVRKIQQSMVSSSKCRLYRRQSSNYALCLSSVTELEGSKLHRNTH